MPPVVHPTTPASSVRSPARVRPRAELTREELSRRDYQRQCAARGRAARLASANRHATHCTRQAGKSPCGFRLEDVVDRTRGIVVRVCRQCDRRRAGLCRDCPCPVEGMIGRALRCAACKRRAVRESIARHVETHAASIRARARAACQADPAKRARRNAYKRLYRAARPDQVAQGKRRAGMRQNRAHEKMLAYHRTYNAERRAHKNAIMTAQYRAVHAPPAPHCATCRRAIPYLDADRRLASGEGRPPTRCVFCMEPAALRAAVQRWVGRIDRELVTPAPTVRRRRPVRPWTPRARVTRYTARGERLCWNADCPRIVRGREKKCADCKARERLDALALLEIHRGRGRRTDLTPRAA